MKVTVALIKSVFVALALSFLTSQAMAQESTKKTSIDMLELLDATTAASCAAKAWKETTSTWGSCGDCRRNYTLKTIFVEVATVIRIAAFHVVHGVI